MVKVSPRTWKTPSGATRKSYRVRYVDKDGIQRQASFSRAAEAKEFAENLTISLRDGTHVPASKDPTLREIAEEWFSEATRGREGKPPLEASTLRGYRSHLDNHILPHLGDRAASRMRTPDMVKFRDALLASGVSAGSVEKALVLLHGIFGRAVLRGDVASNIVHGVRISRSTRHEAEEYFSLPERADVRRLLFAVDSPVDSGSERAMWWRAVVYTLMGTGFRVSEVLGLPMRDFLQEQQALRVSQRADERGVIGPPKSRAGRRMVYAHQSVFEAIHAWLKVRSPADSDLVFCNGAGRAELYSNLYKRFWVPTMREAGLTGADGSLGFTIHSLRHFHASMCIAGGMDPKTLQHRMGHSSIKVTMDIYGHLFHDEHAEDARRVESIRISSGFFAPVAPIGQGLGIGG